MKEIFCFIPAKHRSKRLKGKNQLLFDGFPLFYYPIQVAKESGLFKEKEVVLSSDAQEILDQGAEYGAFTPYKRGEELSKDPAGVYDVLIDFLERFPQYKEYKYVCILLPTSPLTSPNDICDAFKVIKDNEFNCLLSVSETPHNAHLAFTIEKNGLIPLFPQKIKLKSQELNSTYHANGAIHIVNVKKAIEAKSYLVNPIGAYEMPFERSIDIDTKQDLMLANFIRSWQK